ncbi:hypothetical protein T265_07134 [Opisthorchis viverrini]|uniref:Uncharacterized protein n=1 Tax=Opisthorchis viverrini TaxID=6198 RepID=A0A075ACD3_OPIVI|nr:hypothetical protein T265_07134 [Opisthorchis viverrini]KER25389.1 hypothetical protein T265_07134 [Opisthorchis viverrini]
MGSLSIRLQPGEKKSLRIHHPKNRKIVQLQNPFDASMPCHRRKHEGWDTARLSRPRQENKKGRGPVRTMDLPITAMPSRGSTRAGILPGCPSLDRGSRVAEVGLEPRTFRSVNSRSNHLGHLAPPLAIHCPPHGRLPWARGYARQTGFRNGEYMFQPCS